jgi:hypothetical protein
MEVYSIEENERTRPDLNNMQPNESVASSLSTQVLIRNTNENSAIILENIETSIQNNNKLNNNINNNTNNKRTKRQSFLYIFTIVSLFLIVSCFLFMTFLTIKLLINNNNNSNNYQDVEKPSLNTNRNLDKIDREALFKYLLKNFEKNAQNLTDLKVVENDKNTTQNLQDKNSNSGLFERNLFSWLKNTFKMSFFDRFDSNTGSKYSTPPVYISQSQALGEDPFDSLSNIFPYSRKPINNGGKT